MFPDTFLKQSPNLAFIVSVLLKLQVLNVGEGLKGPPPRSEYRIKLQVKDKEKFTLDNLGLKIYIQNDNRNLIPVQLGSMIEREEY